MISLASLMGSMVKGGLSLGHFSAQAFGRLSDRKREGGILLDLTEMFHRIAAPSWGRPTRQPVLGGAGDGPSRTDSRLTVIAVFPRGRGDDKFLFD